jgi:hypothetical protein
MTDRQKFGSLGVSVAAAIVAGRFAEPQGDILGSIQGLSQQDIDYVVQSTNPYEMVAPQGLLGDTLFPERRTQELSFSYLKGAGGAAVMAHVTAHTGEAPIVGRRGITRVSGEIPALKQKRTQDASTIIRLQSADDLVRSNSVQELYDDTTAVRLGIAARKEKLRMDALATGRAAQITDEGLVFDVDYQVPGDQQATLGAGDTWNDDAADPLADMEEWQNAMVAATGQMMSRAITSRRVLNALRRHPSIRRAVHGVNYERLLTTDELNGFLAEQDLPTFITYDLIVQVKNADGSFSPIRLWPDHRLTLIPDGSFGPLGRTHLAPTAEEGLSGTGVSSGIITVDGDRTAVHMYTSTQDPKGIVTLGTASAFPSFEGADHVFQAAVLPAA